MTKRKSTKRSVLMNTMALILCFVMLIGTTYAWFTDSVTSGNNIIASGTLDVTFEWADGTEDPAAANWKDASEGAIFNYDLWEPGYTEVRHIKIENEGTLALKYKLDIVANGEVSKLADVIDVYYIDPAIEVDNRADLTDANKMGTLTEVLADFGDRTNTSRASLEAGEKDEVTIAFKMQESAGNEYQGLAIGSDFSVQLLATQYTHESDSFDNQYDADATFYDYEVIVNDAAELVEAIQAGKKAIALNETVALTSSLNANGVTFIGLEAGSGIDFGTYGISGNDITYKNLILDNDRDDWYKGMEYSNAANNTYENCTFVNGITTYGNSTFKNCTFNELPAGNYALFIYGGKNITVDGCTFQYGNRAIKIYNEGYTPNVVVNVSNTSFTASETSVANKAMIEIDDTYMSSINVTVNNIDVDSKIAAQGVYRIDDGALDTSTEKSKVTVDGVTTSHFAVVADKTALDNAIAAGTRVDIELEAGTYKLPAVNGKDLTISGTKDAVIDLTTFPGSNGTDITFEGVTVKFSEGATYNGFQHSASVTYKDCAIIGGSYLYSDTVFDGCTFTGAYYITTYSAKNVTFNNCDFNKTDSRTILVYNDGNDYDVNVTVENCRFNSTEKGYNWDKTQWIGAIDIDNSLIKGHVTVNISGNTITDAYNGLVRHKAGSADALTIIEAN